MSSSMRWRNGETVGVEMSMVLLLSMNEADCLDHQHRRTNIAKPAAPRSANTLAGAPTARAV